MRSGRPSKFLTQWVETQLHELLQRMWSCKFLSEWRWLHQPSRAGLCDGQFGITNGQGWNWGGSQMRNDKSQWYSSIGVLNVTVVIYLKKGLVSGINRRDWYRRGRTNKLWGILQHDELKVTKRKQIFYSDIKYTQHQHTTFQGLKGR